jgi:hypothetical protein
MDSCIVEEEERFLEYKAVNQMSAVGEVDGNVEMEVAIGDKNEGGDVDNVREDEVQNRLKLDEIHIEKEGEREVENEVEDEVEQVLIFLFYDCIDPLLY